MKTCDFDYNLPEEYIAQAPASKRDCCKMLVMDKRTGEIHDRIFKDILDYVRPGDLFIVNETRVISARLLGAKRRSGGAAEIFLLRENSSYEKKHHDALDPSLSFNQQAIWEALVKPGKRLKPGSQSIVDFKDKTGAVAMSAEILDWSESASKGERIVRLFTHEPSLDGSLHNIGHTPLPPYIKNYVGDEELYQTVYSKRESSAAAPTAGLHFTPELISDIKEAGAEWKTVELEVGLDTFRIVDEADPRAHQMHTELYTVPKDTVEAIQKAKSDGGRVIAVGTTSVRSLESAWDDTQQCIVEKTRDATSLYLLPGSTFHVVDAMITNFHIPRSTLMMLVSAFSSRDMIMNAYEHAKNNNYRFLSFGDAMFMY